MTPSSSTTPFTVPPASGWYTDPQSPHQQRWWDGGQWTAQVRPAIAAPSGVRVGAAKATRALVFAIVGLVLFPPLSVAAFVMGVRARGEGKQAGRPVDGRMGAAFVIGIVGVCFWGLIVVAAIAGASSTTTISTPKPVATEVASAAPVVETATATATAAKPASTPVKPAPTAVKPAPTPVKAVATPVKPPAKKPEMTSGQKNALESAQSYLDMGGFSKKGLIRQLSSSAGEGFSKADATFAVNHAGADWNHEAVESAQSYLDMGGFSRQSLIRQLSSSAGEGFTQAQAVYAVNKVY